MSMLTIMLRIQDCYRTLTLEMFRRVKSSSCTRPHVATTKLQAMPSRPGCDASRICALNTARSENVFNENTFLISTGHMHEWPCPVRNDTCCDA